MQIEENIPLVPFTTFKIGGPARFFVRARSVEDLKEASAFARNKNLTALILGGGSNVLLRDEGFDGLVIKIEIRGVEEKDGPVIAGAGEEWDTLVRYAIDKNLWGIENLSGIPGSVGGAVVQGIGAYGQAIGQTLEWAEVFDTESGEIKIFDARMCAFGYRDSLFKHDGGRTVVLRAAFKLSPNSKPVLSYRDVGLRLQGTPAIGEVREAILAIRKNKFPNIAVEGTAGSFFKNPILSLDEVKKLQEVYPDMPVFAMPETVGMKIPLAWFLDTVLKMKGLREGRARLFERQPLVIVVERGATATEVRLLAERVVSRVRDELAIDIEPEVRIL